MNYQQQGYYSQATIYKSKIVFVSENDLWKVDKKGGITYYEPLNQVAADNLKKTPIPSLVKSDSTTRTESLKTEWAEFTILFYGNGVLEIQAR